MSYSYAFKRNCLLAELRDAVHVSEYQRNTLRDEFTGTQRKVPLTESCGTGWIPNSCGREVTERLLTNNCTVGARLENCRNESERYARARRVERRSPIASSAPTPVLPVSLVLQPKLERVGTPRVFAYFSPFLERRASDFQVSKCLGLKCVKLDI